MNQVLRHFFELIGVANKKSFYTLVLLILCSTVLELIGISLIIPLLSIILSDAESMINKFIEFLPIDSIEKTDLISYVLIIFFVFYIFKSFFIIFTETKRITLIYGIQEFVSNNLFKNFLKKDFDYHLYKNSSEILQTINTEVINFAQGFASSFLFILIDSVLILSILIFLFYLDFSVAILTFSIFLIGSVPLFIFSKKKSTIWGERRHFLETKKVKFIKEAFEGIQSVKINQVEELFEDNFHESNFNALNAGKKQSILQSIPKISFELLIFIAILLIVFLFLASSKDASYIVNILGIYAMSALKVLPSITRLVSSIQGLIFSKIAVFNIYECMQSPSGAITKLKTKFEPLEFNSVIDLNGVFYKYPNKNEFVFENINLTIPKGEVTAIIGPSGSGKSTLVNLITGLLEPFSGKVKIDDIELGAANRADWLKMIGYVPQSVFISDDSIVNNIAWGKHLSKDLMLIENVIDDVCLRELIDSLPDGLDQRVGESASNISGGQKQRLGISRALYKRPKILILDEATSGLDSITEKTILENLISNPEKRTIILITHQQKNLDYADNIYEIKNSKIELIKKKTL